MRTVEGIIEMIGDSYVKNDIVTYTTIQIGNETLQKVKCSQSLANYISMGLKKGGVSKIFIRGKVILGVSHSYGKKFCYKPNFVNALILGTIGLGIIAWVGSWSNVISNPFAYVIGGLGALTLYQVYGEYINFQAMRKLQSEGAVAIGM